MRYITIKDAAALLGLKSPWQLQKLLRRGLLKGWSAGTLVEVGSLLRYRPANGGPARRRGEKAETNRLSVYHMTEKQEEVQYDG
jgi:hypothetical protein